MAEQNNYTGTGDHYNNVELIKQNILNVMENIAKYAALANRDINEITLIGVSKFFPAQTAENAVKAGLDDLGENRVGDLIEKQDILASHDFFPNWHLIGTLQRKKVKQIIGRTALIHSVDTMGLLEEISRRSVEEGIITPVLIQMNTSGEESKHGFYPDDLSSIIEKLHGLTGADLQGMMTMAPLTQDEKVLHDVFSQTHELFIKMKSEVRSPSFQILSMGMSNDYRIAILHGATHLRIGTAIFGLRT